MGFDAIGRAMGRGGPTFTVESPVDDPGPPAFGGGQPLDPLHHGLPEPSQVRKADSASRGSPASLDGSGTSASDDPRAAADDALRTAGRKLLQARKAGVDVARMTCLSKALGLAASAIGLGVAVALAVASLGAAAPLVAVASVRLVQAAADARDARQCLVNARRLRDGEAIPAGDERPLGANALGNLLHGVARRQGLGDLDAVRFATNASAALSTGLSIVALAVGMAAPSLPLSETLCQWVNSGLLATLGVGDATLTQADRQGVRLEDEAVAQARDVFRSLVARLAEEPHAQEAAGPPATKADLQGLEDRARLAFMDLLDEVAPTGPNADDSQGRLRKALLGELGGWTVREVPNDSDELFGAPFRLDVVSRNRGSFGPDGGASDSGGAIGNGLLSCVFSVFENLPLPVMQALVTTARVAGVGVR